MERIRLKNPIQLWTRECQCAGAPSHRHGENKCKESFQTPHAPERPEIIYCESCYQQEVA